MTRMINGPEAFTPDNEFILGESEVRGFFVAAGFCAHGIAGTGGIGQQMAHWIVDGEPELDLWKMDIRRFGGAVPDRRRSRSRAATRTTRPTTTSTTRTRSGSPAARCGSRRRTRTSRRWARSSARSRCGSARTGSRPNEDGAGVSTREALEALRPRGWAGQHWSPAIGAEALATRQAAGLFDESSFAKIEIEGPGALDFLQRLCANDVDRPVGSITYTQMLNRRGGIECDFTVTRLAEDRFLIVTGTAFGNHDLGWIRKQLPADGDPSVRVRDVTVGARVLRDLGAEGPRHPPAADEGRPVERGIPVPDRARDHARRRARARAPRDLRRRARLGAVRRRRSTGARCGARSGRPAGSTAWSPAGYRAIDALRLEKGYRVWSSDITPEETPYEAGLGFAVKLDKARRLHRPRGARRRRRPAGPRKRLRCLVLDDPRSVCLGERAGSGRTGEIVGRVTSGGYGFAVERSIAFAYLPPDQAAIGTRGEVEVFGEWIGFEIAREPLWDPDGGRIRS